MSKGWEEKCERKGCYSDLAMEFSKGLPRKVKLCQWCYSQLTWAIHWHRALWEQDPNAFLEAFLERKIEGYPADDPHFRRRLQIRAITRLRKKYQVSIPLWFDSNV